MDEQAFFLETMIVPLWLRGRTIIRKIPFPALRRRIAAKTQQDKTFVRHLSAFRSRLAARRASGLAATGGQLAKSQQLLSGMPGLPALRKQPLIPAGRPAMPRYGSRPMALSHE